MTIQLKTLFLGLVLCFATVSAHAERVDVETRKANAIDLLNQGLAEEGLEVLPETVELSNSYHPVNLAGQLVSQSIALVRGGGTDFEVVSFQLKNKRGLIFKGWTYLATSIGCTVSCDIYENEWVKKTTLPDGRTVYTQLYTLIPKLKSNSDSEASKYDSNQENKFDSRPIDNHVYKLVDLHLELIKK